MKRPRVLIKSAMSVDGFIDDSTPHRLILSNQEDFDRVDARRAESDAVLVGASVIRRDNPQLLVKTLRRREIRRAQGKPAQPARVTLTRSGDISADARFFATGEPRCWVYCPLTLRATLQTKLGDRARVIGLGALKAGGSVPTLAITALLEDLAERGVHRLMIEGGGETNAAFLASGLIDEVEVSIAPFLVGDPQGVPFARSSTLHTPHARHGRPMSLISCEQLGNIALLRYESPVKESGAIFPVRAGDRKHLQEALALGHLAPITPERFRVGAVLIGEDGHEIARAHTGETDPAAHAEEVCLEKAARLKADLHGATIYSSLEPCSHRATAGRPSCAQRIITAGISRVVYAWGEPSTFVEGRGEEVLREAGVAVRMVEDLAAEAIETNRHLRSG